MTLWTTFKQLREEVCSHIFRYFQSDWLVSKFSLCLMRISLSSYENRTSEDDSKPKIHSMNFLNRLAIK